MDDLPLDELCDRERDDIRRLILVSHDAAGLAWALVRPSGSAPADLAGSPADLRPSGGRPGWART